MRPLLVLALKPGLASAMPLAPLVVLIVVVAAGAARRGGPSPPISARSLLLAAPLMALSSDCTVVLAAVVKLVELAVPSLTVMTSVAAKPNDESNVVAVMVEPEM